MPDQQVNAEFLEGLYQTIRKRAAGMATKFSPGYDSKELDGDDLETVWNHRSMSIEEEWELWRAKKEDGTPLYTREQIGALVYDWREKAAKSGGRVEPKEWIGWTNQTAKRMAAKREARAAAQSMGLESVGKFPATSESVGKSSFESGGSVGKSPEGSY